MAYKDILVVADDTPESKERVQYAIRLAARHEAHAIGMMLRDDLSFAGYAAADVFSGDPDTRRQKEDAAHARVREGVRTKRAGGGGCPRMAFHRGRPGQDDRPLQDRARGHWPSSDRVAAKAAPSGHPGT